MAMKLDHQVHVSRAMFPTTQKIDAKTPSQEMEQEASSSNMEAATVAEKVMRDDNPPMSLCALFEPLSLHLHCFIVSDVTVDVDAKDQLRKLAR